MIQATIADIDVIFNPADRLFFEKRSKQYFNTFSKAADMVISTEIHSDIIPEKGALINQSGSTCIYRNSEERQTRTFIQNNTVLWEISYNTDYSDIRIRLSKNALANTPFSLTQYEYILSEIAFSDRISYLKGIILHGSAITYNNNGIIFSGKSGAGKSTHAHLWKKHFKNNTEFINDDKPAIVFKNKRPYVYGTMWSGKSDLNNNICSPLKAIVFIEQADTNNIRRLNTTDSLANLTSQVKLPYYDTLLGEKMFDSINKLIDTVPVYMLSCTMDAEAVHVAHKELFNL